MPRPSSAIAPPPGQLVPGLHQWKRFHYDMLEAMNWSTLKDYASGNLSRARYYEQNPQDSSADHFRVGEAVHCCVLEPERFAEEYIVKPASWPHGGGHLKQTATTTKEDGALNRKEKADWDADAKGKEILSADEGEMCFGIRDRLRKHRIIGPIVNKTVSVRNELTCISKLDDDLWTKSLIDIEISVDDTEAQALFDPEGRFPGQWPGGVYLADLKTSSMDIAPGVKANSWGYTVARYKYHGQAAFYMDNYERATGIKPAGFFFIPVEKAEPWEPAIYAVLPEQLDAGRKLYTRCIEQREACVMRGKFPGYTDDGPLPMSCAEWGLR